MELFDIEFITKIAAIGAVFVYAWTGLRKVPSREDLEKLRKDVNTRMDEKMKALECDMKEVKEQLVRSDEHNRQDHREIRELIQQRKP